MSWKRFGGIKQLESFNNLNVNSITTDELIMREPYNGTFTIHGELFVLEDCSFNAGIDVGHNATVGNSIYVQDRIYIGDRENDHFFDSNAQGIGVNVPVPQSVFDICGNNPHVIHVYSPNEEVKSTLVHNINHNKGALIIDNSFGTIHWEFDDVSANITFDLTNDQLFVDKNFLVQKDLLVTEGTLIGKELTVEGNTLLKEDLRVMGNLDLEGNLSLNSDLSMSGSLFV